MSRSTAAAALAVLAAAVFFPDATAAQEEPTPSVSISPATVAIGQVVEVYFTCPGGTDEGVTSPGLSGAVTQSGAPAFVKSVPGTYTATVKCRGTSKVGTAEFTVLERVSATFRFIPERPKPGQAFRAEVDRTACPSGPFVFASTGFRDAIRPNQLEGVVVDTPGRHSVVIQCWLGRNLIKGGGMLEIAEPDAPAADRPAPSDEAEQGANAEPRHAPVAGPRKPIIKPKGAPQTGGGGTA
ncbi:hypothetical protein UK23_44310 [Lentzea aerocolonigenes]|uniref:Lipoprotein n=1 Tax=Lentzea aerocolonigenes TaxID=68170 RepID=A0A0F0GI33_LENAE|nr:hypothetical protein [Lentzea aerocolonigenes]KJK33974.1 hypothetical protein UK23_44310 [Lentzea aerocolonigenes]